MPLADVQPVGVLRETLVDGGGGVQRGAGQLSDAVYVIGHRRQLSLGAGDQAQPVLEVGPGVGGLDDLPNAEQRPQPQRSGLDGGSKGRHAATDALGGGIQLISIPRRCPGALAQFIDITVQTTQRVLGVVQIGADAEGQCQLLIVRHFRIPTVGARRWRPCLPPFRTSPR